MSSTMALVPTTNNEQDDNMWGDIAPMDPFSQKKEEVAACLAALMAFEKKNRAFIASEAGWSPSRVTNVLSGELNLTIKTLWEFASSLGYNFDVVFREDFEVSPCQPWSKKLQANIPTTIPQSINYQRFIDTFDITIKIQTPHEVASDIHAGVNESMYFSFKKKVKIKPKTSYPLFIPKSDYVPLYSQSLSNTSTFYMDVNDDNS